MTLPSLYNEEGDLPPPLRFVSGVFVPKGGVAIGEDKDGDECLFFPVHRDTLKEGLYSFPWPGWERVEVDGVRALREFIGITDAKSAKAFAEKYGPLYEAEPAPPRYWRGSDAATSLADDRMWLPEEWVFSWLSEARQLRAVLRVATALQEGSGLTLGDLARATVDSFMGDEEDGYAVRLAVGRTVQSRRDVDPGVLAVVKLLKEMLRVGRGMSPTEEWSSSEEVERGLYGACAVLLSGTLTSKLRRLGVVVTISPTLPFHPEFFTGLGFLPILWQQAAAVIGGGRSLALCSVCGLPYVRRHRAARRGANNYCSQCSGSSARQRLHRRKKRGPLAPAID